ncbi:hypothetical protein V2J09_006325 [Rumex salicifolius]
MVAGKFKQAMGLLYISPSHHHNHPPPSPTLPSPGNSRSSKLGSSKSTVFSRSLGAYLPRAASVQVQPRPPDVSDLLRLVEELRAREHRLQTELLENKLVKEADSIVPFLESELASKSYDLDIFAKRIGALESENQRLTHEGELLRARLAEERRLRDTKVEELELEVADLRQKLLLLEKVRAENDEVSASQRFQGLIDANSSKSMILVKNPSARKITRSIDTSPPTGCISSTVETCILAFDSRREQPETERPPKHYRSNSEELPETSSSKAAAAAAAAAVRSRIPRVPKPPPKRISSSTSSASSDCSLDDVQKETESSSISVPAPPPPPPTSKRAPPPPPPLPIKGSKLVPTKVVRRVPEVVELYHSLMRRDSRRDSVAAQVDVTLTSARDLVGEIENRSTYLSAIKTDVETQGDFIFFLIKEVENAAFFDIEDVVLFVKWLDDELSYLVDERAVLKHFSWPEQKADALREAAFEYCDLKKLESEASSGFKDDAPRQSCSGALKKMQAMLDKLEHGVYNLSRLRESAKNRFKLFDIPVDWMLETGFVSQIKLASVKLAMKYIKRVSAELETVGGGGGCEEEELIVQGVRFAFRVHQFAGGFDAETMRAFQELRNKANTCHGQQQRLLLSRTTAATPC